jgi:hypothetical protein
MVRNTSRVGSQPRTAAEVHAALANYLRHRPDVGLDKLLLDLALDPASPFDPQGRRRLKKGFVLVVVVAVGLAGTFIYFNFF